LLERVPAGLYRNGVAEALTSVFSPLRTRGTQLIWIGAVLALAMYLIGPGRGPTWLRQRIAAGARFAGRGARAGGHGLAVHGPGWTAAHVDTLRVGGVVVAAVLGLLLSSWTSLLVIAVVLAAYEVLVTVAARMVKPRSAPPGSGSDRVVPDMGA
jgi:hypothetical protein